MILLLTACAETVLYGGGDGADLNFAGGGDFRVEGSLSFAGMSGEDLESESCDGRVFARETRSAGSLTLVLCGGEGSVDVVQYSTTRPALFESARFTVGEDGTLTESNLSFSQGSTPIEAHFDEGATVSFDEDEQWWTGQVRGTATFEMVGGSTFDWTQDLELTWALDRRPHVVTERRSPFAD